MRVLPLPQELYKNGGGSGGGGGRAGGGGGGEPQAEPHLGPKTVASETQPAEAPFDDHQRTATYDQIQALIDQHSDPNAFKKYPQSKRLADASEGRFTEDEARAMIQDWSNSSVESPGGAAMQQAISEKLGVPMNSAAEGSTSIQYGMFNTAGWDKQLNLARAFVDVQYKLTQADLKAAGITHLTLFRGVSFYGGPSKEPPGFNTVKARRVIAPEGGWDHATLAHPPLSSWSTDQGVAARFAKNHGISYGGPTGFMMAAKIDARHVLSVGGVGVGARIEREVIVMAHPMTVGIARTA